ncbi:MAG: hypothetical protein VCA35_01450, partial [Roseibacillus sp.]
RAFRASCPHFGSSFSLRASPRPRPSPTAGPSQQMRTIRSGAQTLTVRSLQPISPGTPRQFLPLHIEGP